MWKARRERGGSKNWIEWHDFCGGEGLVCDLVVSCGWGGVSSWRRGSLGAKHSVASAFGNLHTWAFMWVCLGQNQNDELCSNFTVFSCDCFWYCFAESWEKECEKAVTVAIVTHGMRKGDQGKAAVVEASPCFHCILGLVYLLHVTGRHKKHSMALGPGIKWISIAGPVAKPEAAKNKWLMTDDGFKSLDDFIVSRLNLCPWGISWKSN